MAGEEIGILEGVVSDLVEVLRSVDPWSEHDCYIYAPLFSKAANRIEELEVALRFYTGLYEPGLSNPNEGPWGINSTDFGEVARKALDTA